MFATGQQQDGEPAKSLRAWPTSGVAFCIGGSVEGGLYGEYPSLKEHDQLEGDLHFNNDFRSTYSTILEGWLGLDAVPIVNGNFEQLDFIKKSKISHKLSGVW